VARFLALDWDQNQLHLVLANVGRNSVRVQRAAVWHEERTPNPAEAEELGRLLRERIKEAGFSAAPVLACVSRDRLVVKEVRIPPVPASEEPSVVRFQAVKELNDNPDEVILDYVVQEDAATGERKAVALIIRKEVLETYQTLCQAAGLKLAGLTPRSIGISATLRKVMGTTPATPAPEPADAPVCVVVASDRWVEFLVVRGQALLMARSLSAGPNLVNEVRRNLSVYNGQNPRFPVKAIYITGKNSSELRALVAEQVDAPIHALDPFGGSEAVDVPVATRGTFAGAAGLLHAQAAGALPIDFVHPRQPVVSRSPNFRLARLGLVAAVGLVVCLFLVGHIVQAQYREQLNDLEAEKTRLESQVNEAKENVKRVKALEEWDNVVWLDEIYELTAQIPDVNALRVTSITADPLPRTSKSRFVAVVTIKGRLVSTTSGRKPLDELVNRFNKEGYYSCEAPKVEKDQFTLKVNVERRSPAEYKSVVTIPEKKAKGKEEKGKAEADEEKGDDQGDGEEKPARGKGGRNKGRG